MSAGTLQDHAGHNVLVHGPRWSGCTDCRQWIDTRPQTPAPEGSHND